MAPGHVVLVGLMGSGKTTVGRIVSERLGLPMVDNDAAVEAVAGKTVRQLWEEGGEPAFRRLESAALLDALARPHRHVIAAAGGVVVDPANRAALQRAGTVVWLRGEPAVLAERAVRGTHRPLLTSDPEATFERLQDERAELYDGVADLVVDVSELPPDSVADRIVELVAGGGR